MSFLTFLTSNNNLSHEKILEALIIQQKRSTSLLEILSRDQSVSAKEILDLVAYAQAKNIDLQAAQKKLKIIAEAVFDEVFLNYSKGLSPIGKICVDLGFLSIEQYAKLLTEFQDFQELQEPSVETIESGTEQTVISEEATSDEPEISAAALESLRELGIMDDFSSPPEKKN